MKWARLTQWLVNTFPPSSYVRNDIESLGYQLFNVIGNRFDDLRKQQEKVHANWFLPTSVVSDIDVYYAFKLPGEFEFTKEDDDDTELLFTAPTVSGQDDGVYYPVSVAANNDIESFWYTATPSRISLDDTNSQDALIASGYIEGSPFDPLVTSGLIEVPNRLTITLSGGTTYIGLTSANLTRKGLVQIQGITRAGKELTEELIFLHDDVKQTIYDFREISVSGIRIYGIDDPSLTHITVTSANFNNTDYAVTYPELGDKTLYNEDMPLFWAIGSGQGTNVSTLDLMKYNAEDLDIRLAGYVEKSALIQQELVNASGDNILPLDITIEPFSDKIWAIDGNYLYLYSSDIPYPTMSDLTKRNYDAACVLEPDRYYLVKGETLELNYVWKVPTQGIVRHRATVVKPDGTRYSLEAGAEVAYHTNDTSWTYGEPTTGRQLRETEFYTLDQRGEYLYTLECGYVDGSTSFDQRIIYVVHKEPLVQFNLNDLAISTPITGIDFDSEYKLWVRAQDGTRYQLGLHYDVMLVDVNKKVIYFRENYSQVRVY